MFCSLDEATAKYYLNDTKSCYNYQDGKIVRCNAENFSNCSETTMLKIIVSKNTHLLDLSYFDTSYNQVYNQILLSYQTQLKVIDVRDDIVNMGNWRHDFLSKVTTVTAILLD
jgi:hypothetical protein